MLTPNLPSKKKKITKELITGTFPIICENVVPQTQQGTSTINVTEVTVMLFQRILKFVLHKAKLSQYRSH